MPNVITKTQDVLASFIEEFLHDAYLKYQKKLKKGQIRLLPWQLQNLLKIQEMLGRELFSGELSIMNMALGYQNPFKLIPRIKASLTKGLIIGSKALA